MHRFLRRWSIGVRMAAGFGFILLSCFAMLAATLWSDSRERQHLRAVHDETQTSQAHASALKHHLLLAGISVRNMGLQTTVEGVEKHQAEAKSQRKAFLAALELLSNAASDPVAAADLGRLKQLDSEIAAAFDEAVGLASQFNTEQAAAIISERIDPLTRAVLTQLDGLVERQEQAARTAALETDQRARRATTIVASLGLGVLAVATLMAWQLTVGVTRPIAYALRVVEAISHGDLRVEVQSDGRDEPARLLAGVGLMRESLASLVDQVRASAESVTVGASEIAQGNLDLSNRTESQASCLQQAAASLEQISGVASQNAHAADRAVDTAVDVSKVAVGGGHLMQRVVESMAEIESASRQIGSIVGLIDSLAFQTNILALNAAVEAARAGDKGRGFAVVAAEVRTLAGRSAEAARNIRALASANEDSVRAGAQTVGQSERAIRDVVARVEEIRALLADIARSAVDQASEVGLVNHAVSGLDQTTQQNAALVEEAAAAAQSLKQQAERLLTSVSAFSVEGSPTPA